jgi:hypothetical protein
MSRRPVKKNADVLLRGLDRDLVALFKQRAKATGRSLQAELRLALQRAAGRDFEGARSASRRWKSTLQGRAFPNTTELLREDRSR